MYYRYQLNSRAFLSIKVHIIHWEHLYITLQFPLLLAKKLFWTLILGWKSNWNFQYHTISTYLKPLELKFTRRNWSQVFSSTKHRYFKYTTFPRNHKNLLSNILWVLWNFYRTLKYLRLKYHLNFSLFKTSLLWYCSLTKIKF